MDTTKYFDNNNSIDINDPTYLRSIFNNAKEIVTGTRDLVHEIKGEPRRDSIPPYGGTYDRNPYNSYVPRYNYDNVRYPWGAEYETSSYTKNNYGGYPGITNPYYGKSGGIY